MIFKDFASNNFILCIYSLFYATIRKSIYKCKWERFQKNKTLRNFNINSCTDFQRTIFQSPITNDTNHHSTINLICQSTIAKFLISNRGKSLIRTLFRFFMSFIMYMTSKLFYLL